MFETKKVINVFAGTIFSSHTLRYHREMCLQFVCSVTLAFFISRDWIDTLKVIIDISIEESCVEQNV